jgi:hypothetical protein
MGHLIVLEWLAIVAGGITFLAVFGRPWRYRDHTMAWHLSLVTAVAVLEIGALLVAGISLVPGAIVYGLSAVVVWWRLVLLLRIRRQARRNGVGRGRHDAREPSPGP